MTLRTVEAGRYLINRGGFFFFVGVYFKFKQVDVFHHENLLLDWKIIFFINLNSGITVISRIVAKATLDCQSRLHSDIGHHQNNGIIWHQLVKNVLTITSYSSFLMSWRKISSLVHVGENQDMCMLKVIESFLFIY